MSLLDLGILGGTFAVFLTIGLSLLEVVKSYMAERRGDDGGVKLAERALKGQFEIEDALRKVEGRCDGLERKMDSLAVHVDEQVDYVKGTWKKVSAARRAIEKHESEDAESANLPRIDGNGSEGRGVQQLRVDMEDDAGVLEDDPWGDYFLEEMGAM